MEVINAFFFSCFGAVLASFLNLCVYRLEKGGGFKEIALGRSSCEHCNKVLGWKELVPIFSYLFLRGKCINCQGKINKFYLFSEILLALIFFLFILLGVSPLYFIFLILLFFWGTYDFYYQNIPKRITDVILFFSFVFWLFIIVFDFELIRVYPALFVAVFALFIYILSLKKTVFGLGDILVFLALAFWLEWALFLSTVVYTFILGGVFGLLLVLVNKKYLKEYIPFLPFVFLGFVLAILLESFGVSLFEYMFGMC